LSQGYLECLAVSLRLGGLLQLILLQYQLGGKTQTLDGI
jgi:hypothetical protein